MKSFTVDLAFSHPAFHRSSARNQQYIQALYRCFGFKASLSFLCFLVWDCFPCYLQHCGVNTCNFHSICSILNLNSIMCTFLLAASCCGKHFCNIVQLELVTWLVYDSGSFSCWFMLNSVFPGILFDLLFCISVSLVVCNVLAAY